MVGVPQTRRGNSNDTAGQPPPGVSMQEAPGVSALAQVIFLLMDHHRSPNGRHPTEERRTGFHQGVNLSSPRLEVPEVSGMVGMVFTVWIVVPGSGAAPLAQVSILVDVDGCGLVVSGEASDLKKDPEFSLRVNLLEEHVTLNLGQTLWQRAAGSQVAGGVQAAIVLRGLWWSCSVTLS